MAPHNGSARDAPGGAPLSPWPVSPRSTFIRELLGADSSTAAAPPPLSTIILRSPHGSAPVEELDLSYQGIGDRLGVALSGCLRGLPCLRSLNIRDCRLTDLSLAPILVAAQKCPTLTSLDLGSNKMDAEASSAMGLLLAAPDCPLLELGVSKADVDDAECGALVGRLEANANLTALDLSHNLIGGGEVASLTDPAFSTGARAIARMLEGGHGGGAIRVLNLAWNMIRRESATALGRSLAGNLHLVDLDLSYNSFGDEGGLAVAGALFSNRTLRRLHLASNALQTRAAFALAAGCRENPRLEYLDLRSNPLGQVGGRALMHLALACGDRLSLRLESCDLMSEDPSFTLDKTTQLPREAGDGAGGSYALDLARPHRRAMALEVLRVAAEVPGVHLEAAALDGKDLSLPHALERAASAAAPAAAPAEAAEAAAGAAAGAEELLALALRRLDDTWREYDADGSGTLSRAELRRLMGDLGLGASAAELDRVMATYDCDRSGLLERAELEEYLGAAAKDCRDRRAHCAHAAGLGASGSPRRPFELPLAGALVLRVGFRPDRGLGPPRATSSDELRKVLALAARTDDRAGALDLSMGLLRLQVEQGQELVSELMRDTADIVKVLAQVLPCMLNSSHAQVLVNVFLANRPRERRRLEKELGPAFCPLMGYLTGHYSLDMRKPAHQVALLKLAESNSLETKTRRSKGALRDTSQKGNWSNLRNEVFGGAPFELRPKFFDPLPPVGFLELDYVSTSRPSDQASVLSDRRFASLVEQLAWGTVEGAPQPFEPSDPLPEPKVLSPGELFEFDKEMAILRGNKDIPVDLGRVPTLRLSPATTSEADEFAGSDAAVLPPRRESVAPKNVLGSLVNFRHTLAVAVARARNRVDEMLDLRDLIYTRWFSTHQALWILRHCPLLEPLGATAESAASAPGHLSPESRLRVELTLHLFSRIADLAHFDVILSELSPRERAQVTHRLGWLNIFSPYRAELGFALDLREREDRVVAKLLVHMSVIEPGENVVDGQFAWDRCLDPVPGWALPQTWFREDGMPTKGSLKLQYFSGPKKRWANRSLRTALMDVVLASPLLEEVQAYGKNECLTTSDFISHSLRDGCEKDCGVPITWVYEAPGST